MKKKRTILIVDDNMNFIQRMIGILDEVKEPSYINVANNFEEAKSSMNIDQPDIVLLDINLPGRNGIELLKDIKNNRPNCDVIMISNHTDFMYRKECQELGATIYLDKTHEFFLIPGIINEKFSN